MKVIIKRKIIVRDTETLQETEEIREKTSSGLLDAWLALVLLLITFLFFGKTLQTLLPVEPVVPNSNYLPEYHVSIW
jgi:hypothetical protein